MKARGLCRGFSECLKKNKRDVSLTLSLTLSGDPAAQTEHSEGDPRHAEGSAAVYGAGPLPVPLPPSVQSHALTTSLGMTTPLHRSHINLN